MPGDLRRHGLSALHRDVRSAQAPRRADRKPQRPSKIGEGAVTRLDIAEAGPEGNLVGLLRKHIQEAELPAGWRQAVMVTGIEQRLDYSAEHEDFAFLHQTNLLRDALPEAARVPVVLWLSRMASAVMPVQAPDLWDWRAASFDFTGDEAPRAQVLRELTTLRPEDDLAMSGDQRRARVRMLKTCWRRSNATGRRRRSGRRASGLVCSLTRGSSTGSWDSPVKPFPCSSARWHSFVRRATDRARRARFSVLGSPGSVSATPAGQSTSSRAGPRDRAGDRRPPRRGRRARQAGRCLGGHGRAAASDRAP